MLPGLAGGSTEPPGWASVLTPSSVCATGMAEGRGDADVCESSDKSAGLEVLSSGGWGGGGAGAGAGVSEAASLTVGRVHVTWPVVSWW